MLTFNRSSFEGFIITPLGNGVGLGEIPIGCTKYLLKCLKFCNLNNQKILVVHSMRLDMNERN